MIKYCSENKNCLTPSFVSSALSGITHRFVLVLECETRSEPGGVDKHNGRIPPRFAIGGPRATIDPRNAKFEELLPISKHKLELPPGWEKVHQYMYVLQPSTDEHGWQYRSVWSNGVLNDADEPWVKSNSFGLDARRRLWITTVVKKEDVVIAKSKLSEAFKTKTRGVIMLGDLYRQEARTLRKVWQRRFVVLTDNKLEIYVSSGGKKIAELALQDCDIKMLFGVQCPGREYAFSIRDSNGNLVGLFDADNREIRRRWVVSIRYQLAIHCAGVNFPPFDYGPPTGDDVATRVLMCGELMKQGSSGTKTFKNRFFQLTPLELQWFDKEVLRGTLPLAGGKINENEKSGNLDFTVTSEKGRKLLVRTDTQGHKNTWIRAIQRQIDAQNAKRRNENTPGEVTDGIDLNAPKSEDRASVSVPISPAAARASIVQPEPEPEPEPELDPEPEPTVTETPDEVVKIIRRYSIEAAEEGTPDPTLEQRWEGSAEVVEAAESAPPSNGDSNGTEEHENVEAERVSRHSEGEFNADSSKGGAAEEFVADETPVHPYEQDPDIVVEMFQGLEIKDTPETIDGEVEEVELTAAEPVPEAEPEPEPSSHEAPMSPGGYSSSAKADVDTPRSKLAALGRPLAKRSVVADPNSRVQAEVQKIEGRIKRRFI